MIKPYVIKPIFKKLLTICIGDAKLDLDKKQLKVLEEKKKIEMEKLSHMKDLEVDLTSYLVSQNKIPDKHYRFDTSNFNKEGNQISQVSADIHPPIQVHLSE